MNDRFQTVVETPSYLAAAKKVLSQDEQDLVVKTVAQNPAAGTAIGGGIRKMRFARSGTLIATAKRIVEDYRRHR